MKHLTLIRHAKSSWGDASLHDFDRPLNERGLRDAPRIGAYLKELNWRPRVGLTSATDAHTRPNSYFQKCFETIDGRA